MAVAGESISRVVDVERYPLHEPDSAPYDQLIRRCRDDLATRGMFDLVGLLRPGVVRETVHMLRPLIDGHSFVHRREHNIYFQPAIEGLAADHPALALLDTANRTVCADQLVESDLATLYQWPYLRQFIARVLEIPVLFEMRDHLAKINVMSYRDGEALNWHFDRSPFTTTLLLQQPLAGGEFEYRPGLRTNSDPNFVGVGELLAGNDDLVMRRTVEPGTLNVFAGRNTAHRVSPVRGALDRVIAVFSYYERPEVVFSESERIGFYGRA